MVFLLLQTLIKAQTKVNMGHEDYTETHHHIVRKKKKIVIEAAGKIPSP